MIKQATIEDIPIIEDILLDAIKWMRHNKLENMWDEHNSKWECLSKKYKICEFYICYIDNQPAGCVAITDCDKTYWPEIIPGKSLFLHKLAVKRRFAGKGISIELIKYAKMVAINRKIYTIRLDCNKDRKKLRTFYEKQGFKYLKEVYTSNDYGLALYICSLME